MKKRKKNKQIIGLTNKEKKLFAIVGIIIFFLPTLFVQKFGIISFRDTGPVGDTIGGITAPFLSFFGSILVYLALKAQIEANRQVQKQFKKQKKIDYRQNFELLFSIFCPYTTK